MFALSACGGGEEDEDAAESTPSSAATPFGSVEEVTSYLAAIGPFVRQISDIQADLEQRGVGSTGAASPPVTLSPRHQEAHPAET